MAKKRGNGEGTLQHRSDGRWSVTFFAGYQDNGKPLRKTAYGKTQQEAIDKGRKLKEQIDKGILIDKRMRFEEWADAWYKGFKGSVSESTYDAILRTFTGRCPMRSSILNCLHLHNFRLLLYSEISPIQPHGGGLKLWLYYTVITFTPNSLSLFMESLLIPSSVISRSTSSK